MNCSPALGTVLANEEVIDGKSERGGHPVQRRPLRQRMLRITDDAVWKTQRAASGFPRKLGDDVLRIYTTRPVNGERVPIWIADMF